MRQVLAWLSVCVTVVSTLQQKSSSASTFLFSQHAGQAQSQEGSHGLPSYGKVAILVRGQSYRGEEGVCISDDDFVNGRQEYATSSFVDMIVRPLRCDQHNQVDIVVTDSANCTLTAGLVNMMGGTSVVKGVRQFDSGNQALSMQGSIRSFENVLGGVGEISKYDLVLIVRHDLRWANKAVITNWTADFALFNFPDTCNPEQTDPQCTSDVFHTMPGKLYPAYTSVILNNSGTRCFDACQNKDEEVCHQNGHHCFASIRDAVEKLRGGVGLVFRDGMPGDGKPREMDAMCNIVPMSEVNENRAVDKLKQCCESTPNAGCCTGQVADAVRKKYGVENIQPAFYDVPDLCDARLDVE